MKMSFVNLTMNNLEKSMQYLEVNLVEVGRAEAVHPFQISGPKLLVCAKIT